MLTPRPGGGEVGEGGGRGLGGQWGAKDEGLRGCGCVSQGAPGDKGAANCAAGSLSPKTSCREVQGFPRLTLERHGGAERSGEKGNGNSYSWKEKEC